MGPSRNLVDIVGDETAIRIHAAIEQDELETILAIAAEHGSVARVRC